ncbi:UNVERIFIED_CONTAM: hypothetical protein FKN15_043048 [Acipenser sinensis]
MRAPWYRSTGGQLCNGAYPNCVVTHLVNIRAKASEGELKADSESTLLFVYKARLTKVGGLHSRRGLLYSGMKQQSPVEEYTAGWLSNNRFAAIHSTTLNRAVQSDKRQGTRSGNQQQAHSSCQTAAGGITRQRGCDKAYPRGGTIFSQE